MQSYFEVARETRFTNPLRIPHEDASSSLVSGKCGYLRQRRNIPITMQICAIIQVLSFVRYCVRCVLFCYFWTHEKVSVFEGFRHFKIRFSESASHTPRRRVKLACKRQVRVSSSEIFLRCSKSSYQLFNC